MGVKLSDIVPKQRAKNFQVDTYKILSKIPCIRVNLKQKFVDYTRKEIRNKYKNFMNCARTLGFPTIEDEDYTPLKTWLRENKEYRSAIPIVDLLKLSDKLGIAKKEIYRNILSFQIWAGKEYKPLRFLPINKDLAYGLGLYIAEGKNTDKKFHRVGIANSEENILKFVVYWFQKYLNIPVENLKFYANLPFKEDITKIKKGISEKFLCSTNMIRCYKNREAISVTVDIVIDCKALRLLIEWLKTNMMPIFCKDVNLGLAFVQGVFDGEGHIRKTRPELIVEMKDTQILDICELILRKTGVTPNRHKNGEVLTIEERDFPILKKIRPFRFHRERMIVFEKICDRINIIRAPRNQAMTKIMRPLKNERGLTVKELTARTGYKESSRDTIFRMYKKAKECGYVTMIGGGTKFEPYKISITKGGLEYLQRCEKIKSSRVQTLEKKLMEGQFKWAFNSDH